MAGSKSTAGASGRVQKKKPGPKAAAASAPAPAAVYRGSAKGVTELPVARIKRIIKEDKDIGLVSNDAVFLISLATEYFLESFTQKAFNLAKIEKKKSVFYKHLATAVTQHDSLEFLQDVIPKTMPLSEALERRQTAMEQEEQGGDMETGEGEDDDQEQQDDEEPRSETEDTSRPMSEDEELSAPDDMDED
ncbi:DNA polymerase epsilon subunit 4 [Entomortierella parvispora]|uniref:DNA polymerase epsilon subunit 4 n=1 Tax=Entomortierella parvispora TaxID=205924 RepID=A0A9P3M2L7_9FUNG|nr:DNA polymerase epsilon subunit 4 [Entomortierella parvispora]